MVGVFCESRSWSQPCQRHRPWFLETQRFWAVRWYLFSCACHSRHGRTTWNTGIRLMSSSTISRRSRVPRQCKRSKRVAPRRCVRCRDGQQPVDARSGRRVPPAQHLEHLPAPREERIQFLRRAGRLDYDQRGNECRDTRHDVVKSVRVIPRRTDRGQSCDRASDSAHARPPREELPGQAYEQEPGIGIDILAKGRDRLDGEAPT